MATVKERIEPLETRLGVLQDGMQQMKLGLTNRFHQTKETTKKLSKALLSNNNGSISRSEI